MFFLLYAFMFLYYVDIYLFIFFFLRYRGLNAGAFYLRATPPALFFILYFETRSHEVAEDLTKERERELRLAANPDLPVSASQSTGITSVCHHIRLTFFFLKVHTLDKCRPLNTKVLL